MRRVWILPVVACLSACSTLGSWFERGEVVDVIETGRAQQCGVSSADSQLQLFKGPEQVIAWQQQSGIELAPPAALHGGGYLLVQMGQRNSGGYGLAVSRDGKISGGTLHVYATYFSPAKGSVTTQALTSPCVLVRLPRSRFDRVDLVDQNGKQRAEIEVQR